MPESEEIEKKARTGKEEIKESKEEIWKAERKEIRDEEEQERKGK